MAPENDGGWSEYRHLILQELQRLHEAIIGVQAAIASLHASELAAIKSEIAVLKFKSGLWGFTAGAIPGMVALIYAAVKT